jgi:tRNA dimethylallyltransferase
VKGETPTFLAIVGPTASGKTQLSMAVAARMPVEIISMDSRQVYRGMDVGTDKVTAEARALVPHHCLDLIDPDQRYSAGRFARDVRRWVGEIRGRGRLPLLVGGTGFFLKSVMEPIFAEPPLNEARLQALRSYMAQMDVETLALWVHRLDPVRAELAVQGGPRRMTRTIEVALLTGRPLSWWHREAPTEADPLNGFVVVLDVPRDEMDRRIDARVESMVERGLLEEVRSLLDAGYGMDDPGMTGTGYRQIARHLEGEMTLDEALSEVRQATRRYARRQITWYRHQLPTSVPHIDAMRPVQEQLSSVLLGWSAAGGSLPGSRSLSLGATP